MTWKQSAGAVAGVILILWGLKKAWDYAQDDEPVEKPRK